MLFRSFTITSTNDAGTQSQAYTLEVLAPSGTVVPPTPFMVFGPTPDPLIGANGKVLTPISLANAGATGYKFEITLGSLPAGLSFDTSTGVISGTPTSVGESYFTVAASSANGLVTRGYRMTILVAPTFTSANTAVWVAGQASSFQIKASGTPAPVLSSAGYLPAGLLFDPPKIGRAHV